MKKDVDRIITTIDLQILLDRELTEWRNILIYECQVYVFDENYIAKRFDAINYQFCDRDTAKEILIDNLYALLRYKYFQGFNSEKINRKISSIVADFTTNLKTTLRKITFDKNANESESTRAAMLPDFCIAFRNGVYNFRDCKWFLQYEITNIPQLTNKIYQYDPRYIITWYFDFDFVPLGIDLKSTSLHDLIALFRDMTATEGMRNYCFELMYNMSHDENDIFSEQKFEHLCEIMGYTVLQSFSQYFVMLIGAGQNGKNSLLDGCFTYKVVPRPASNDLDAIENDRFITGSLINKYHNIFLETSPKLYTASKMIKALTGSMYQTIEEKGVNKYSSIINCKFVFAGNDQDKIKFSDTTTGFRRRINMLELFYQWDENKAFLQRGDYYDTSFSDSLAELQDDLMNIITYIYFAVFGIMKATKCFTRNFKFSLNDWRYKYTNINVNLRQCIEEITIKDIAKYLRMNETDGKSAVYDADKNRLYLSPALKKMGLYTYEDMCFLFESDELSNQFFAENDIYVSLQCIQTLLRDNDSSVAFGIKFKKLFMLSKITRLGQNKSFAKCRVVNGKIRILE